MNAKLFSVSGLLGAVVCLPWAFMCQADEFKRFPPPPSDSWFARTQTTNVIHWSGTNTQATLIFMPGGDGQFNMKYAVPKMFMRGIGSVTSALADSSQTRGVIDGVFFDSVLPLQGTGFNDWPSARTQRDHLERIEMVVRHYKAQTGQPVWLMGHSNGSFSVAEFVKHLQKKDEAGLLSGIVLSGSRDVVSFNGPLNLPILFIHHREDGCSTTSYTDAQRTFEKVKKINAQRTVFVTVEGGMSQGGHPCFNGTHMMNGLYMQMSQIIEEFILEQSLKN